MSRLRVAAALAAAVLVVSSCGDSGGNGGNGGNGEDGDRNEIAVIGTEFVFTPATYTVDAGTEVTVTLTNEGSIEHNWVLLAEPIRSEDDLTDGNILAEAIAQPGEAGSVTFPAPAPGDYQVICDIPGHFAAGMEGDFTVDG